MHETGAPLIPKGFRIEFLAKLGVTHICIEKTKSGTVSKSNTMTLDFMLFAADVVGLYVDPPAKAIVSIGIAAPVMLWAVGWASH